MASRADVATDVPARYAKQLISHLGRKVEFRTDGASSTATIAGATARVVVGDGVLSLHADGDAEGVARAEEVLASHLERFGQRDGLTVTWTRTTSPTPEETR